MTEKLARRLSIYFAQNGYVDSEKRELLEYGIFHILSSALHITLLLFAGVVFSVLPGIIAYSLFFCSLKRYIGGSHASKHWACLWGFTLAALIGALLGRLLILSSLTHGISVALSAASLMLILWRAPAVHPNAPRRTAFKMKMFKKQAVVIAVIQFTALCLCTAFKSLAELSICGSLGSFTASLTLLLPIPNISGEGGVEHEKSA